MNKNRFSFALIMVGAFLSVLNQTLMSTALPGIMRAFHITTAQGQWLNNGYLLINALMIPTTAYLIKRFTTRQLYLTAGLIFIVGSLIGAIATVYPVLIVGRMIQALGAGIVIPLVNVVVMTSTKPTERGAAMGVVGLALNLAPVLGPTVSGMILVKSSWRYLFGLTLPLMLLDALLAWRFLKDVGEQHRQPLDRKGLVLSGLGLALALYSFSNVGETAFLSLKGIVPLVVGAVLLAWFVKCQWTRDYPLLNLHVFRYRQFNLPLIINMLLMVTMYGNAVIIPVLVQNVFHRSAVISGLTLLPGSVLTAIISPLSGRFYDRYNFRRMVISGLCIDMTGSLLLSSTGPGASIGFVILGQTIRQLGLVLVLIPIQTHAWSMLPTAMIPDGVAVYNTLRQVAASFGTALLVAIISITASGQFHWSMNSQLVGIKFSYLSSTLLVGICVILGLQLHKSYAEPIATEHYATPETSERKTTPGVRGLTGHFK
ncbi:MDR family MFS transporter [Levilactobacillus lindianensis]|uniref:MDR family MFS transporter n=1 Tax=Levilactobacillus lindianensis TaxID=2486018 RepID=UPI000F73EC61|nr:MDR family MFS transporter [Levilactobacillus lindianensis]